MQTEAVKEVIFVGLPGLTHHYGGMAAGNVASQVNAGDVSHPRDAAQQALALMEALRGLGQEVAVLPPQLRPCVPVLRVLGFAGTPDEVIAQAMRDEPALLGRVSSSAAMWTANAATVTAAQDSQSGRLQLTPANLTTHFHRSIEARATHHVLSQIFRSDEVVCHAPLPSQHDYADEGAANHLRLALSHGGQGLNVFVYGRGDGALLPRKYPARQSLAACRAIARRHRVAPAHALFVQQNPRAIDAGVFHNDVISVANEFLLLTHEQAFAGGKQDIERIREACATLHSGAMLCVVEVLESDLSIEEAVQTYFFNSQIVTLPEGGMAIIAPQEVKNHARAHALMDRLIADVDNPLRRVMYLDLRQSMKNGGGPACLRLRVPMALPLIRQLATTTRTIIDDNLLGELHGWVRKHYRETLTVRDIADPALYHECQAALGELEAILRLSLLDVYGTA